VEAVYFSLTWLGTAARIDEGCQRQDDHVEAQGLCFLSAFRARAGSSHLRRLGSASRDVVILHRHVLYGQLRS